MNPNDTQNQGVDFDNAPGEAFAGLNILRLNVGQADGPFEITQIVMKSFGEGTRKRDLPQVTAQKGNIPYTMPVCASFQARLQESGLKKGDTFLLKRGADYDTDQINGCESYMIKVVSRAK